MAAFETVRDYIRQHTLLHPGDTVVVGVSGGADSVCLLALLQRLAGPWSLTLHVAHLQHGLRPEADQDLVFVAALARQYGLPLHSETVAVRQLAAESKQSIEEAARNARYAFLVRVARLTGAAAVAVAHTADDQAETVLMHVLRGSGLAGLRGMQPQLTAPEWPFAAGGTDVRLIRPCLSLSRADVEQYCQAQGLTFVQDQSNLDRTYFRNRLRHDLLPALTAYNPQIRAVLGRMAAVAAGEYALVQAAVDELWIRLAQAQPGEVAFDRMAWRSLSLPQQRALLRRAVQYLRASERDVDFVPLDQAARFSLRAGPGRVCDVVGGVRLSISSATVRLNWGAEPPAAEPLLLTAAGILPAGWMLTVETVLTVRRPGEAYEVYVDAETLPGELQVRGRRPGDRFCPAGLQGHHIKLADFMINEKIDRSQRARWPLVVAGEAIVWVAGLRLDERFVVRSATRRIWRLRLQPAAD